MFSGDMLLNPQIFGRAQPSKRGKSKRTHVIHHKTTTTINTKIASSSSSSSLSPMHKHKKYGKSLQRTPTQRKQMNQDMMDNVKESGMSGIPGTASMNAPKEQKQNKKEQRRQRYKIKMNFEDNEQLFRGDKNKDKRPLPGTETKQQLISKMMEDEFYCNVICHGQMPSKQILIGLFYLLLVIAIDSYVQMVLVSIVIAAVFVSILFIKTNAS